MPTVYSASSSQWPVLQSTTETKHESGLISISGQFISPADIVAMPTMLPSSTGEIYNLYPLPTRSTRDGWNTYNATGYGIWSSAEEVIKTTTMIQIACSASSSYYGSFRIGAIYIRAAGQSATVRKVVSAGTDLSVDILPSPPALGLIGKQSWSVNEVFPYISPSIFTGHFSEITPTLETRVQSVRTINYGTVTEIEATYELTARIDFGEYATADAPEI
jgi:hypothetical protein